MISGDYCPASHGQLEGNECNSETLVEGAAFVIFILFYFFCILMNFCYVMYYIFLHTDL